MLSSARNARMIIPALLLTTGALLGQQTTPTPPPTTTPVPQSTAPPVNPTPPTTPQVQALEIGGNVTKPILLNKAEAPFSQDARDNKISGTVRIRIIVDKSGKPTHVAVVSGVGHGLDESAVEAVRQYKFKPATRNGESVPVLMYIDVNFQLIEHH